MFSLKSNSENEVYIVKTSNKEEIKDFFNKNKPYLTNMYHSTSYLSLKFYEEYIKIKNINNELKTISTNSGIAYFNINSKNKHLKSESFLKIKEIFESATKSGFYIPHSFDVDFVKSNHKELSDYNKDLSKEEKPIFGQKVNQLKQDLSKMIEEKKELASNEIYVSALNNDNIDGLKQLLASVAKKQEEKTIIGDLIDPGDVIVLVIPIDQSAPKGRLILPQQLVLRDILDHHAIGMTCQVEELDATLKKVTPKLVITDSQAFNKVSQIVDKSIHLTSFSILMARLKGSLSTVLEGANKLDHLQDGDCVLISEGCTHHRQCGDIGTDKLPKWILNYTKKNITFEFTSGQGFKEDLSKYSVVIHCGACMLNEKEVQSRVKECKKQHVPFTNYGIAIAKMNGILDRSVEVFNLKI